MQVMVCPGPRAPAWRCPVLDGQICPLVDGADIVVCALASGPGGSNDIPAAHTQIHPGTPVVAEGHPTPPGQLALDSCCTDDALIGLLQRILADRAPA
jgi:hypothetical protein